MVFLANHGGSCCGARHIYGFNTAEDNNPDLINQKVSEVINGQSIEVILNGNQVERYPRVLERLDQLGFVLTDHWRNGNHGNPGTHNYRFIRCDRRERLLTGPIADRWAGMVNHPGLEGNLTPMHNTVRGAVRDVGGLHGPATETLAHRRHFTRPLPTGPLFQWHTAGGPARAGDTVRVNSFESPRYGREFVVARTTADYLFMNDGGVGGVEFRIARYNCVVIRRGTPPPEQREVYQEGVYRAGARVLIRNPIAGYERGRIGTIAAGTPQLHQNNPGQTVVHVMMDSQNPTGYGPVGVYRSNIIILNDNDTIPRIAPMAVPEAPPAQAAQPQRHNNIEVFEGMAQREVAPAQPVVVFRTYHNIYRDGRVGAGYDTLEAARNARNGDGRIDRREISSDGTTVFIPNVQE